jgi:uncharacterized protein (DUF697 family)
MRDLLKAGEKYSAEREKPVRVAVLIDAESGDEAVAALRTALTPQTGRAMLHVEGLVPGELVEVDASADVVIALAGPRGTVAPSLARARERAIPAVAVGLDEDRDQLASRLSHPVLDCVADTDVDRMTDKLGHWLADRVPGKRVALAANFAFVRRAVAEEAVKATSFQNAVIGGVVIIPGADLPLMTANQAKMVMQIAAVYGEPLGAERVKEIASVVGGAFVLRAVARQFVGLVPGFGWAIKAGIGYSGTLAMGYAAIEYFEAGGSFHGLGEKLQEARDRAVENARLRRTRPETIVIDAGDAVVITAASSLPEAGEDASWPVEPDGHDGSGSVSGS